MSATGITLLVLAILLIVGKVLTALFNRDGTIYDTWITLVVSAIIASVGISHIVDKAKNGGNGGTPNE